MLIVEVTVNECLAKLQRRTPLNSIATMDLDAYGI
jgi:hypothetical protein